MKKKYIQLGVVALVLLVMVGALILLNREPAEVEVEAAPVVDNTIYIYGDAEADTFAPDQIDIHNEYGDMIVDNITPEGALPANFELTIRGWENLSLDTYNLNQVASNARAMRAKAVIAENATAEDLKTFGFDSPKANIKVRLQNGASSADDTQVVLFGENAPGGEGVYVKLENGNTIYLISESTALPYLKPATAYVNKTITATDPDYNGFDKITLTGTNYPEPLVIERVTEENNSGTGITLYSHTFVSPIKRGVDSQKGLEPLSSVYGLMANDVVAVDDSAETLEKYGLKDPATVISVVGETSEMTFTLRISNPDENGEVHLIKSGSKVIYELSPYALPFLNLSMFDMMDKMVVVPNIQNVAKVVFATQERSYEFVLTQEDEGRKLNVTVNGVPLLDTVDESGKSVTGGENFRKLYQTMIACRYNEPIPKTGTQENLSADAPSADVAVDSEAAADTQENPTEGENAVAQEAANTEMGSAPDAAFLAGIRYIYNDGTGSDYVAFYEGPPRKTEIRLFKRIDDFGQPINLIESGYYGQSIYLDRLLEDVEKVINGIAVKPYL